MKSNVYQTNRSPKYKNPKHQTNKMDVSSPTLSTLIKASPETTIKTESVSF